MDPRTSLDEIGSGKGESLGNRSVERACRMLSAFTVEQPWLSLAELARRAELPKATAHRLATTLRFGGLLSQAADGRYGLGVRLLELGTIVRQNLDVVQVCGAAMDGIAEASGETVLLVTADWPRREVLLVAHRNSPHPLAVGTLFGRPQPIPPSGALGKALLAGLPPGELAAVVDNLSLVARTPKSTIERRLLLRDIESARKAGYASEQDEFIEGASGVGVAVIFENGLPRAAIGVVGPTSRLAGKVSSLGALLLEMTVALRPGHAEPRIRSVSS